MPPSASRAELAARVPVPVSAVCRAVLAHCAGSSTSSQAGNIAAVARVAPSPATTNSAISHPRPGMARANSAPRAAKLALATSSASPVETGCGSAGRPNARAARISPNPAPSASPTPSHQRPVIAAATMPMPIRPTARIGAVTSPSGAGAGTSRSHSMAAPGSTTPASSTVNQASTGSLAGAIMAATFGRPARPCRAGRMTAARESA